MPASARLCSSPDWLPRVRSIFPLNPQGVWTSRCHGNRPPPAHRSNLWPPTFSVRPSQSKSLQHNFFFLVSPFRQGEATGRPHSDNFLEPEGKGPFCEFVCNPRVWAGHGWVRGSVAGVLPRRSRVQGPRAPRLLPPAASRRPRRPPYPRPYSRRRAGAGPSGLAAVATGAHSIRTCRRTLSITEATT